jgi:hypothetical protein
MRANIIACLLALAYFAGVALVDAKLRVAEQVRVRNRVEPGREGEEDAKAGNRVDAYKLAVLMSVMAAVISTLFV